MVALLHVKRHLIQKKLYDEGGVNIPILQLRKLRLSGVRKFGQDHTVKRGNLVSELSRV